MDIFLLFVLFFCHWLGDFTHLSNAWMRNAKKDGSSSLPILAHAIIHGTLVGVTLILFDIFVGNINTSLINTLFIFEVLAHYLIDLFKGKLGHKFKAFRDPTNNFYWWLFGLDQYIHSVVLIVIAYYAQIF